MKNVLSYCGLVDVRIDASDKDLPVQFNKNFQWLKWYVHENYTTGNLPETASGNGYNNSI